MGNYRSLEARVFAFAEKEQLAVLLMAEWLAMCRDSVKEEERRIADISEQILDNFEPREIRAALLSTSVILCELVEKYGDEVPRYADLLYDNLAGEMLEW